MKKIPPIGKQWKEALERYKYVLIVITVGLFLLLMPTSEENDSMEKGESTYNLSEFEQHLASHLSLIEGAGKANVVLTLKTNGEKVYAEDVQQEFQGKNNRSIVVIGSGSSEQVVEIQEYYPEFQGALVICSGGDNATVKLQLIQAVSALTGLSSHNITICKSQA